MGVGGAVGVDREDAAVRGRGGEVFQDADHGGDADARRDQHQRGGGVGVDDQVAEREGDLEGVAGTDLGVQPGGDLAGGLFRGRLDTADGEGEAAAAGCGDQAVLAQLAGTVG
ncbi:Uncharacterised protein [Mycobacteroides abscessus subsp. abscessus]|nr:Uncharacterised protein [Mycobacteroides abscessus subsp. abscessus]